MKLIRTVLLLLLAFLLCACHTSVPLPQDTAGSGTAQQTAAVPPLTDTDSPDARYESGTPSYTLTEYEERLYLRTYSSSCFCRDGSFWGDTSTGFVRIGADGGVLEELHIPQDTVDVSVDSGKTVLTDGSFIIMESLNDPYLYRMDADGNILAQTALPNAWFIPGLPCVIRADDSRIYLLQGNYFYSFDLSLTQEKAFILSGDFGYGMHILKNGTVVLGETADTLSVIDPTTGTLTPYPDTAHPDAPADGVVRFGTDDRLYYAGSDGIFTTAEDGTLTALFLFAQGPVQYNPFLQILDPEHVLVYTAAEMSDTSAYYLMQPNSDAQNVKQRRVITMAVLDRDVDGYIALLADAFNRSSSDYYIELQTFHDIPAKDAYAALREAFVRGDEMPDIVCAANYVYLWFMRDMGDKNAFVDLTPYYADAVWSGLSDAYTVSGALSFLPLGITMETLAAPAEAVGDDGTVTLSEMYGMADTLTAGQALFSDPQTAQNLYNLACRDFIDYEAGNCSFDTEEFRSFIRFTEQVEVQYTDPALGYFNQTVVNGAGITVSTLDIRQHLKNGDLRFMTLLLNHPKQYIAAKMLWADTDVRRCGYPTADGSGVTVQGAYFLGITASSEVQGGAAAFFDYALSAESQTAERLTDSYFPVTRDAAEQHLRRYRYYYPADEGTRRPYYVWNEALQIPEVHGVVVTPEVFVSPAEELFPDYAQSHTEVVMTEEDIGGILAFLDSCTMYGGIASDASVTAILEEELSAYTSGAKTLEEVTSLIQSRVWIYLNE